MLLLARCLPSLASAQTACAATGMALNARHYKSDLTAVSSYPLIRHRHLLPFVGVITPPRAPQPSACIGPVTSPQVPTVQVTRVRPRVHFFRVPLTQLPDWLSEVGVDAADYTQIAASPSLPATPAFSYNLLGATYTSNIALLFQVKTCMICRCFGWLSTGCAAVLRWLLLRRPGTCLMRKPLPSFAGLRPRASAHDHVLPAQLH